MTLSGDFSWQSYFCMKYKKNFSEKFLYDSLYVRRMQYLLI